MKLLSNQTKNPLVEARVEKKILENVSSGKVKLDKLGNKILELKTPINGSEVAKQEMMNFKSKLENLAKEGNIDISNVSLGNNEFLNNLKILAKINSSIDKKFKNTTGNFVLTPFMRKVYKEKDKTIQKYIKNIEKGKIDGNYLWDIHDNKASITFEISGEFFQFHVPKNQPYIPIRIKKLLN